MSNVPFNLRWATQELVSENKKLMTFREKLYTIPIDTKVEDMIVVRETIGRVNALVEMLEQDLARFDEKLERRKPFWKRLKFK